MPGAWRRPRQPCDMALRHRPVHRAQACDSRGTMLDPQSRVKVGALPLGPPITTVSNGSRFAVHRHRALCRATCLFATLRAPAQCGVCRHAGPLRRGGRPGAHSGSKSKGDGEDREFKRCFLAPWPDFVGQQRPGGRVRSRQRPAQAVQTSLRRFIGEVNLRVNPKDHGVFAGLRKPRGQPTPSSRRGAGAIGRGDGDRRAAIRRRAPPDAHGPGSVSAPGPAGRGA